MVAGPVSHVHEIKSALELVITPIEKDLVHYLSSQTSTKLLLHKPGEKVLWFKLLGSN